MLKAITIHAKDYQKYQYAPREVLTIVGEDLPGYLQGQQNQLAKSTCKNRRAKKYTS